MIRTGLPYDVEQMSKIAQEGAIIDMSKIAFPGIEPEEQIRTTFIFLRNTGFEVSLDWSNCTEERVYEFLKEYITTDIEWYCKDMCDIWYEMLLESSVGSDSYIGKQGKEDGLVDETFCLLSSLPIYIMYRHELNGEAFTLDDIEKKDSSIIGANYLSLLKSPVADAIITWACCEEAHPMFWTKIFTDSNNELMNILANSSSGICQIMHAFATVDEETFAKDMEQLDETFADIVYKKEELLAADQ